MKKNEEWLADDDMKRRDKEVREGNGQPNAIRTQNNTPGFGSTRGTRSARLRGLVVQNLGMDGGEIRCNGTIRDIIHDNKIKWEMGFRRGLRKTGMIRVSNRRLRLQSQSYGGN